jgi:hypothetical protein
MDWSSLTDGDYDHWDWRRKLDLTAVLLKSKQDANVPALMTPYYETQSNGWFWWAETTSNPGAGSSESAHIVTMCAANIFE